MHEPQAVVGSSRNPGVMRPLPPPLMNAPSPTSWCPLPYSLRALPWLSALAVLMAASPTQPPTPVKWEGNWVSVLGGRYKRTLYYGPWQCSQLYMQECRKKCNNADLALMGCIWLVDIKVDVEGSPMILDAKAGGRLAVTHCCCDYPLTGDAEKARKRWNAVKDSFREAWGREFGGWPVDGDGNFWDGHHIHDLGHGGDPTADQNVIPARKDVHQKFSDAYPDCYKGGGKWSMPGPDRPYSD